MEKSLPDKWIRKEVFQAINNMVITSPYDGSDITIKCFDSLIPSGNEPDHYVLMTTQTNDVDKFNKCEDQYKSSILLEIATTFSGSANTGSRLLADEIADQVRNLTKSMALDPTSGLTITRQTQSFPNDLVTTFASFTMIRKFIRIELTIN